VISLIENRVAQMSELVFLDTPHFSKPIAVSVLPFRIKSQVHGNGVDAQVLRPRDSLVNGSEV